MLKEIF